MSSKSDNSPEIETSGKIYTSDVSPLPSTSLKPMLRPGSDVTVFRGYRGTLGGFALTVAGDILLLCTEHQFGESRPGDAIMLEPYGIAVAIVGEERRRIRTIDGPRGPAPVCLNPPRAGEANTTLRIRGLEEDRPIVMKHPVIPEVGRLCVKSGSSTMVTYGKVKHLNWSGVVTLPNGSHAEFSRLLATEPMAKTGDSGSLLFTADTYEPVGILSSGDESGTYFSKLSTIAEEASLAGVFGPIGLPEKTPMQLRWLVSTIIPDGYFAQTASLLYKDPCEILTELGVSEIRTADNRFSATWTDLIVSSNPHLPGDEGSLLTSHDNALVGIAVAGDENRTCSVKILRVLKALNLQLINLSKSARMMLQTSGYFRKFCDNCRASLYPDIERCPFCGRAVYWGPERIRHWKNRAKDNN